MERNLACNRLPMSPQMDLKTLNSFLLTNRNIKSIYPLNIRTLWLNTCLDLDKANFVFNLLKCDHIHIQLILIICSSYVLYSHCARGMSKY